MSTTTTVPRLTLNPNVSTKPPTHDAMAADWPLVDDIGVIVMRGTPSYSVPLWGIDGAPAEIADYLDSLADAITTAAGLEICDGCGFRFVPGDAPVPRFGPNVVDQGDPEALVALVDRLRAEVVTAAGRAWPVETAHDIPPRQCGVADCPEMATHKSGWLVACEAHAMGRQAENGCKAIPLATTVPALTNRSLG